MWYRAKQRILNRGISNGRDTLKEMFKVLSDQGNANQNNCEVLYPSVWLISKTQKMNIVEHVSFLSVGASSGYMPRRGIAGSSGSTMSNFLRNRQTDFQSGCTSLQSHQQWRSVPLSPLSSVIYICQPLSTFLFFGIGDETRVSQINASVIHLSLFVYELDASWKSEP